MSPSGRGLFSHPFARFVAKKVVFYGVVAFVAINFAFLVTHVPGNPIYHLISNPQPNLTTANGQEAYLRLREEFVQYLGFNKPLLDQYINFWRELFALDLGPSVSHYPQSVLSIVLLRLPFTLALVIPVLLLSFFLGNWIGAKAAYAGGKRSKLAYFLSVFSNRLPSFWFGMVLVLIFAGTIKIFPAYGLATLGAIPSWSLSYLLDVLYHYALPFLTLFIVCLGGWAAGMRSMVIHEMDSGNVRHGEQLRFEKSKLMSYANRNAILPQFTSLNFVFSALIGETAILEIIFAWPGLGKAMYESVINGDFLLVCGGFLAIMVVVILGNFLIDILYGFIDPRIRTKQGR